MDEHFTIAQRMYDNMQPEYQIIAGETGRVTMNHIGDWPRGLIAKFVIVDTSDEYGKSWHVEILEAFIGDFDFLICLHDGAISQMEDDVKQYLLEDF